MTSEEMRDLIISIGAPLIDTGMWPEQVRAEIYARTGIGIGGGGAGNDPGIPRCGYCGAYGGGGHGGYCPNAKPAKSQQRQAADEAKE